MRQKPVISEEKIAACLRSHYGLQIVEVRYLPIGYDMNAYVFQAISLEGKAYFVKIREGAVYPPSLLVPRLLLEHGIPHILAPLRTRTGQVWSKMDVFSVVIYPFIAGDDAKKIGLSDAQWQEFGATLRAVHSGDFASLLRGQIPAETFALPSAALVRRLDAELRNLTAQSPAEAGLARFWNEMGAQIGEIVNRAEILGRHLQTRTFEYMLCHADIHAANILVSREGEIYLVDWDGPMLAPRERDLLFVVGAVIARMVTPREEALFFRGYGDVEVDQTALAYYRYERAIEDIGERGKSVLFDPSLSEEVKAEEAALLRCLFEPGDIVESAREADRNSGIPAD